MTKPLLDFKILFVDCWLIFCLTITKELFMCVQEKNVVPMMLIGWPCRHGIERGFKKGQLLFILVLDIQKLKCNAGAQ